MNEPTQEQIKEFWEHFGWHYSPAYKAKRLVDWGWQPPDVSEGMFQDTLPPIDLNNLFKYAVPKTIEKIMAEQECGKELAWVILFKKWIQEGHDALALFWAIYKVIEGES